MPEAEQTITVDDVPEELQEPGGVLTRAMVEEAAERLRGRPERADTMWTIPARFMEQVGGMPAWERTFGERPRQVTLDDIDEPTIAMRPNQLERNRTGQLVVEVDLGGAELSQANLDYAHQKLCAAIATNPGETFELRIKRFSTAMAIPRLIADSGIIYDLLVKLIDEREGQQ